MSFYIKWLKLLKKHGENGVEVIVFNGKNWLNKKNIKDLAAVTLQHSSELRKQRQKLRYCGNYQPCRRFLEEDFATQVIMDCRTTSAVNFMTKLGFNQHDPIMTQEQLILPKIVTLFSAEKLVLSYNFLSYRIDVYFLRYKLAIEF